ncbi:TPA: electron transport complex subunit RsxC [Candidatus Poribacteria bacterium]|nr:electron transport complex subunit RsxC [Candidatus Poribacteria bacterium]
MKNKNFPTRIVIKEFHGGIHPKDEKLSAKKKIENAELPAKVIIPLHQHIGTPARPIVEVGEEVKKGQKIGEATGFISANVHSSISGKIISISRNLYPALGRTSDAVTIESDGKDEWIENITPHNPELLTDKQIIDIISEAGIVGMGGAGFPTHAKLSIPEGKRIETVLLNGAECEPYVTADHALMLEESEKIIDGLMIVMQVTKAKQAFIGIEKNKPDAIEIFENILGSDKNIKVAPLKVKYPQGWENMLAKAILHKEIPSNRLPLDFGVIITNVSTAYAISNAVRLGQPLIERIISVNGDGIVEPKNLRVRIGTLFSDIIRQCGDFKKEVAKVIAGGPMMGASMSDINVPIVKGTNNILVLTKEKVKEYEQKPCIRCARCINVCPVGLMPRMIALLTQKGMIKEAEKYFPLDCKECGCCSYVCPSKIPLVQLIQFAKTDIIAKQKAERAK